MLQRALKIQRLGRKYMLSMNCFMVNTNNLYAAKNESANPEGNLPKCLYMYLKSKKVLLWLKKRLCFYLETNLGFLLEMGRNEHLILGSVS